MNSIYKPYYICDVSGGKDSLFMFYLLLKKGYHIDEVMTVTLEIENPIETKVKQRIKDLCNDYSIKFNELKPRLSYQWNYDRYGLPSPNRPYLWCQKHYKQSAIREYESFMQKKYGWTCVHYIGIALNEKDRIYKPLYDKGLVVYPLIQHGFDEDYIINWARTCSVFDGWYDTFPRLGCTMCPYRKSDEIKWLINKGYDVYSLSNGINFNHYGKGEIIE